MESCCQCGCACWCFVFSLFVKLGSQCGCASPSPTQSRSQTPTISCFGIAGGLRRRVWTHHRRMPLAAADDHQSVFLSATIHNDGAGGGCGCQLVANVEGDARSWVCRGWSGASGCVSCCVCRGVSVWCCVCVMVCVIIPCCIPPTIIPLHNRRDAGRGPRLRTQAQTARHGHRLTGTGCIVEIIKKLKIHHMFSPSLHFRVRLN